MFSTEVTREISLNPNTSFSSLKESTDYWAKSINEILNKKRERINQYDLITEKRYNIEVEAQKLQELYLSYSQC